MNSSFNQLAHEILNNDPAPIPGASKEFSHLLFRMLDKNPATRIKWLVRQHNNQLPLYLAQMSYMLLACECLSHI